MATPRTKTTPPAEAEPVEQPARVVNLDALTPDQREAVNAVLTGDHDELLQQMPDDALLDHAAQRGLLVAPVPPSVQTRTDPESVVVLFARAMGEVGAIAKDGQITEGPQRYRFRGIEQVQQRLQPILVRHGLVILPAALERIDHPPRTTRSGGSMYAVALHVQFTVYGPAGDSLVMSAWGEGADSGDKSSGKAHSMAYKTAMLEAFSIPTEADTPDGDATVPEETYGDEVRARAQRAWTAAMAATTEADLAGVGRRAADLLQVPVEVEGNGSQPLEDALRGRLRYLQAQPAHQGDTGAAGAGGEQG